MPEVLCWWKRYHWMMMATKSWMSTFVCRGLQTKARGGCDVRQPKQNFVEIQKSGRYQISQFKMVDLAGTEKQKRSKKSTQDNPTLPRCANDKPKRAPEEGEGRKFQCFAIPIQKMPGKTRKRRTAQQRTLSRAPKPSCKTQKNLSWIILLILM